MTAAAAPPPTIPWSATVSGLRGRLIVTPFQEAGQQAQIKLELEIENVSDLAEPVAIAIDNFSSIVQLTLEDAAGKPVERDAVPANELTPLPWALHIPLRSTLRVTLSGSAYEYPRAGMKLLQPFAFQAWDIPAKHGPLFLRATLKPVSSDVGGPRAWNGPLELPRVALP